MPSELMGFWFRAGWIDGVSVVYFRFTYLLNKITLEEERVSVFAY